MTDMANSKAFEENRDWNMSELCHKEQIQFAQYQEIAVWGLIRQLGRRDEIAFQNFMVPVC